MSRVEKLPTRGPWSCTEAGRGSEVDVFSRGWIGLTSSVSGSARSRRRKRNLRKGLHTLLNFLGWAGASPYQGPPTR